MESFLTKHQTKSYSKLIQAYDKSTNPDEKKLVKIAINSIKSSRNKYIYLFIVYSPKITL